MTDVVPTWTPICSDRGLWTAEKWHPKGWHWRCCAIELRSGGTLVVGPVRGLGEEAHARLVEVGAPTWLLAPNYFHYMGLPEYLERYPDARVAATDKAAARIVKKSPAELDIRPLAEVGAELPDHVRVLEPPGIKSGEVIVRVETARGVAWICTDSFFHVEQKARGFIGFMLSITGTVPGLRIGRTFTGLAVRGKAYREWLLPELERDPPRILVPGHGAVVEGDDLGERLATLAKSRL